MATNLTERLKLNARQQDALKAFANLVADPPPTAIADRDAFVAMTLPQRFDYMSGNAELVVTRIRAAAQAAHQLYDLLSPDQRRALDLSMYQPRGTPAPPPTPESTPPSRPNFQLPGYTEPDWLAKPTGDEVSRVYPRNAMRNHIAGNALLHCVVDSDGFLSDCTVTSETPKDMGFGNAALETTSYMRMRPARAFGVPVEAAVNVPVDFHF